MVQVGGGRTVSEVAAELACDWHTVNDAVCTYGSALLAADRKRLNRTTAIGLDETSFVKLSTRNHADYATTVADVENHQIIEILPTRKYTDVAGWIDKQPKGWKERIRFGALDMSATYAAVYMVMLPNAAQVVDPFHVISLANRALDAVRRRVHTEQTDTGADVTIRSIGSAGSCCAAKNISTTQPPSACGHCSPWAIPGPKWPSPIGSRSAYASSIEPRTPRPSKRCCESSSRTADDERCRPKSKGSDAPSTPGSTRSPTPPGPGLQRAH